MDGPIVSQFRRLFLTFWRYFTNSDYLAGMLAMSAMGIARDAVERFCRQLFVLVVRFLWVSVRLEEKDAELVLAWLRERPEVHSSTQLTLFSRSTAQNAGRIFEYEPEIQTTTRLRCAVGSAPKQWIWITRREAKEPGGRRLKAVTVSFFTRNKQMLEAIIEKGREIQRRQMEKYLTVVQVYDFGKEHGLNWLHPQEKDRKQPGRSISSVVLPKCPMTGLDQAEALLDDAREFLDSELWYTERGIPYRRGYLLHGVPGGGKSSLVMAIASELMLPIYMLQLSSELMSDDTLNSLLQYGMHDPPTILLLEDVDLLHTAVLHRRGPEAKALSDDDDSEEEDVEAGKPKTRAKGAARVGTRNRRLTLSGLLNALDGPTATTGRLLFMTTNARDRLDPALLRSGRIDYELEFSYAEPEQIGRLFERFYQDFRSNPARAKSKPSAGHAIEDQASVAKSESATPGGGQKKVANTKQLAAEFAKKVQESDVKLTSADVQRHLMKRKTDPDRALRELPALLATLSKSRGSSSLAPPPQRTPNASSSESKGLPAEAQAPATPEPRMPTEPVPEPAGGARLTAMEEVEDKTPHQADTSAPSASPRGSAEQADSSEHGEGEQS